MNPLEALAEQKLSAIDPPLSLLLPGGRLIGPPDAAVRLELQDLGSLVHLTSGNMGRVAEDYVEGRLEIHGTLRDVTAVAARLIGGDPTEPTTTSTALQWWRGLARHGKSLARHTAEIDARQIQFHYDVSDDFYVLWLDPRRVYSCAYFREPGMTLAQAQESKLDLVCRKLMLREGERFLDIGAGWGGLLMWAAKHYGVRGTGITLSRNQHAHVNRLIDEEGLRGRVTMELLDYRALPEVQPWDKIASIGMFEHVGSAQLEGYFTKILRLLRPGGLLLNHGITAGGTRNDQLGHGLGRFIEQYIFPGGELMHVSHVLKVMAEAKLEMVDTEHLRPHYARTLWAWSDNLESRLGHAREIVSEKVLRAYRMYLAGCAMAFERGWLALHQMVAVRPDGDLGSGTLPGAQSAYPFNRGYMYR